MRIGLIGALALVLAFSVGCYSVRRSSGGGQIELAGARTIDPADVALPDGYKIETVARDLTFPTGVAFDSAGRLHVVESGYCYGEVWTTPRLLRNRNQRLCNHSCNRWEQWTVDGD